MTNTWLSSTIQGVKRLLRGGKGLAAQLAIVILGGTLAAGMYYRGPVFTDMRPMARIAASDTSTELASARRAASDIDAGVEHDRIDYWVKRLTTSQSHGFVQTLSRKSKYSQMITAKLEAKQMPRDLIYLAMIESEFNPTAKSRVKAVGMWQFMASTARQFGLVVKGGRDDRKDPARATDAALTYLSDLHKRLGSWYLAAAAYNSGEGTVKRALRQVTGRTTGTDADFFRIMSVLPRETREYVPKLIATARVASAPESYGLTVPSLESVLASDKTRAARVASAAKTKKAPARRAVASRSTTKKVVVAAGKKTVPGKNGQ